jgi:4-amino-4-deoxy-L-arabinose transferase-like glycosyltransferase
MQQRERKQIFAKTSPKIHFFGQICSRCWNFLYSNPRIGLILWTLPLLLLNSQPESLMAHDEGIYAWRARWIIESGGWLNPEIIHYGKTPGIYWTIAASFSALGVSEFAARLPTVIFSLASVILLYEIVKITIDRPTAWLAAAILSLEALWLQYSRLSVPDVPTVCLFLLGLLGLLKAELNNRRSLWLFLAGFSFGLGFLVRSYMIFVPIIALIPYLFGREKSAPVLRSIWFYLGLCVGFLPTLVWLLLPMFTGEASTFKDLFAFIVKLGSEERNNNNFLYYLWNVPLRSFPWSLFAILGGLICWFGFDRRCRHLFVIAPCLILLQLSIFSTRIPHYAMSLYPYVAILAAIALLWLARTFDRNYSRRFNSHKPLQTVSYLGGVIGISLAVCSILVFFIFPSNEINKYYFFVAFGLGLGWTSLLFTWLCRTRWQHRPEYFARLWLGGWLLGGWLAFATSGWFGFWSNYNPDFKTFVRQPEIANIIQKEHINSVALSGNILFDKTGTLIRYYTPLWGKNFNSVKALPQPCYAWVRSQDLVEITTEFRSLGTIKDWQLIQINK